jgi:hypothetical protein
MHLAILTSGACQPDEPHGIDEQQALEALLLDAPLTQVPPGAVAGLTTDPPVSATAGDGNLLPLTALPTGFWNFDDCVTFHTQLFDQSNSNTAYRSVGVTCTTGLQDTPAVAIANPEDIVYVPDQPSFTFERGVTVAGWFAPTTISGTRTMFRKRDKGTSSFALVLNGGKFQFVASVGGRAVSVTARDKARTGVLQHVAGTYDNTTLRLYVDGVDVAHAAVSGTIPVGPGPLLFGNDGSERRFSGTIDSVLFATHALTADEIGALTCIPHPASMVVSPTVLSGPVGVPATIDVALTNHNPTSCPPITFMVGFFASDSRMTTDPPPFEFVPSAPVPSGTTGHFTVTVTPTPFTDPGSVISLGFQVREPITGFVDEGVFDFTVTEPVGCHVTTSHELMIKRLSVVDDPVRTVFDPASSDPRNGVWTFKHLVENIAPTAADAPAMVESMLRSFTTPQTVNGFHVAARPGMQDLILDRWPRAADGKLDLAQAPLRLETIVNRFDLRDLANGDAGEGRFMFGFIDPIGNPFQATMILEYKLPAASDQDALGWARSFHALGALPFSEDYNAALQAITERFVGRGARPDHPGGSAFTALRTNEVDFGDNQTWELRSFQRSPASGLLEPAPLALTPDASFNDTSTLASYINANQTAILADRHTVPAVFAGQPFQAGAIFNVLGTWFAPEVDNEARHHFALNTCNGCHSLDETGTFFLQIFPRGLGGETAPSGFLAGITVPDPVTGQPRTFNDLARRNADLKAIVCADPAALSGPLNAKLRKGIQRVH